MSLFVRAERRPLAALLLALCAVAIAGAGCDTAADVPLAEGASLRIVRYGDAPQPATRSDYARFGVVMAAGDIHLFDPGTGPERPPRFVRRLETTGLLATSAQVDANGFVWLAAPDRFSGNARSVNRALYVIDPHAANVVRRIELPGSLTSVGDVLVSGDWVYLYAWRNGFSAGIGRVAKACATDAARCEATLFTELGDVGAGIERPMHRWGPWLYVVAARSSRSPADSLFKIDAQSGVVKERSVDVGRFAFDGEALFLGPAPSHTALLRVTKEGLRQTASAPTMADVLAVDAGRLYMSNRDHDWFEVRETTTLALVSSGKRPGGMGSDAFGFVAPGMLMLDGVTTLDVRTGTLYQDPASAEVLAGFDGDWSAPMLPEGHAYAY